MAIIIRIDPADTRPIYIQIMDEVRRAVVVGTLVSESPLPSVRQLASELRVNPNTVQQAYRELEREGLIYVRRGLGTFVSETARPESEMTVISEQVADRALRDAYRHGLTTAELIEALKSAAARTGITVAEESKGATR